MKGLAAMPKEFDLIAIHDSARRDGDIKQARRELSSGEGQIASESREEPPLPVRHFLTGARFVSCFGLSKQRKLRVTPIDKIDVRHQASKAFVALLKKGILDGDLG